MNSLLLWCLDLATGRYTVSDRAGTVLIAPFYSNPDPVVMAQHLANSANRPVRLRIEASDLNSPFYPESQRVTRTDSGRDREGPPHVRGSDGLNTSN